MSAGRALRVAVVGAGPSGFFVAASLLSSGRDVTVDLIDRLPTPFGLVRGGVAPDHQNIKAVTRSLDRTARMPGFRYLGNVSVGVDVGIDELLEAYDQVALTTGTEDARRLGVPGEELMGSHSATDFVGWYNGHPDHQHHRFDLSSRRAVVVGVGNVALDVARILLKSPASLFPSDIARPALEQLRGSEVREVVLVGRRGPLQVAFTPAELQELVELPGVDVVVRPQDLVLDDAGRAALEGADKQTRRNVEILLGLSERPSRERRRIVLALHRSPLAISGEGRVASVELAVNRLEGVGDAARAVDTGERESVKAGLVFRAVGYRGRPIPGVPFDPRSGTIPHDGGGRVWGPDGVVPRLYVAGWAKRGPQGVVGTNRACAKDTAARMLEDAEQAVGRGSGVGIPALECAVSWEDWERIDAHERASGEAEGRVREKLLSVDEMMDVARSDP